jgi:hypothetical protein
MTYIDWDYSRWREYSGWPDKSVVNDVKWTIAVNPGSRWSFRNEKDVYVYSLDLAGLERASDAKLTFEQNELVCTYKRFDMGSPITESVTTALSSQNTDIEAELKFGVLIVKLTPRPKSDTKKLIPIKFV